MRHVLGRAPSNAGLVPCRLTHPVTNERPWVSYTVYGRRHALAMAAGMQGSVTDRVRRLLHDRLHNDGRVI